jgi:hypothetical protein
VPVVGRARDLLHEVSSDSVWVVAYGFQKKQLRRAAQREPHAQLNRAPSLARRIRRVEDGNVATGAQKIARSVKGFHGNPFARKPSA